MRPIDFVQPIAVLEGSSPLREARHPLALGTPVAFVEKGDWKMIRPLDAVGYPLTRQVRDLPSRELETLSAEDAVELEALTARDVWGATQHGRLVGRVETVQVLAELGLMHESTDFALEASVRDRLIPRLMHDLSNALTVVSLAPEDDAAPALEQSRKMVAYIRRMYARGAGGEPTGPVDVVAVVRDLQRMLEAVAAPARLTVSADGDLTVHGSRWRLESMLLNLVLNAAAHATRIEVSVVEEQSSGCLEVTDNGPGCELSAEMLASESPVGRSRASSTRGHGLRSVARQVALMGGRVSFGKKDDGTGFVVRCLLPSSADSAES